MAQHIHSTNAATPMPSWLLSASYDNARYFWVEGRIDDDQWEAYCALWWYGAPRFSDRPTASYPYVRDVNAQLDAQETSN